MIRSIYGTILIGVLAAACGGNNGGDSHSCGDGIVNGSEQCDDGNVVSGDGCSSSCQKETPNTCGDGVVDVATEQCDDGNVVNGDGCDSHCRLETAAMCGNGTIDAGETCDDGNHASQDGCSATCQVEAGYTCTGPPSVCTMSNVTGDGTCATPYTVTITGGVGMGSGDTTNATNQIPAGSCDQYGNSGDGNDQIFAFTLTAPADVDIELTAAFDANIRVMHTACDTTTQVSDHVFHDGCADQALAGGGESLKAQSLPAGTYYLSVDGYDNTELGAYTFTITTSASSAVCGNGIYDDNEECDDGGTAPGDRCSATCTLEYDTAEVEPNDDAAHAQMVTPSHHIIKGSIAPTGDDFDLYTFTLTVPATVQFETYDAVDAATAYNGYGTLTTTDCKYDTTYLALFDAAGDVTDDTTALYDDSSDGGYDDVNFIGQCSYIGPNDSGGVTTQGVLAAGTYTIKVEDYNFGNERNYILDIKFSTDPATPVAPVAGDLVLNEFMAADNVSDTNCDGATTGTNDEFIEVVNVATHPVDLTGVTVWDAAALASNVPRHTFAPAASGSMTLNPGKAVVLWAGGAPNCAGVTNWFVASGGQLGLNDTGGDSITLKTTGGTTLVGYAYGDATINKSFNLNPDVTGTAYVLHDTLAGAVGAFSPGKKSDGTAF